MADFEKLRQEWAENYRVPLVHSTRPPEYYVAGVLLWEPGHYLRGTLDTLVPTDEELTLVGKYIQYRNERWLKPSFIEHMHRSGPVDIDPGVNTTVFAKTEQRGWLYGMASWTMGPPLVPGIDSDERFDLMGIMDRSLSRAYHEPNEKWEAFKKLHGLS